MVAMADESERETDVDHDVTDGNESEAAPRDPRSGVAPRGIVIGLGALVVVLAVAVGVLGYLLATSDGDDGPATSARSEAVDQAKKYATSVLTYSSGDYAGLDKRIRAISTPEFADRYIKSSQDARKGNDAVNASGTATAPAAGLITIDDSTAKVLVAVDQHVNTPLAPAVGPEGIDYQSRVEITLKRDGDQWKLSDLSVL